MNNEYEKGLALPLLSGGMDSSVSAFIAKQELRRVQPIFIDWYCQCGDKTSHSSHENEIKAANQVASILHVEEPYVIKIPFRWYAEKKQIDNHAFPYARNLVFLATAVSYAMTKHSGNNNAIFVGFNKSDRGGPDVSSTFVNKCNDLLRVCIEGNDRLDRARIVAPLIDMTKAQILAFAYDKGIQDVIRNSWSCYHEGKLHCGECPNCLARKGAFAELGIDDPTIYSRVPF